MAVNMRRSKLKAEEAALLAGEIKKPTWESKNEGIHERVSFEDAIWGFDLAGGSYYKTPLRVVGVKPDSRAEKAGIRLGDKLLRINDIDTSTLTIQEAHKIILDSGIHLKIAVTAPDDEEDAYFCYEDPLENGYDSEEERRLEKERAKKREIHAKVSSYWSLQWPWVSKRRIIYRESNCFMVPSKYEDNHKDRFSPQPMVRTENDIVLDSIKNEMDAKNQKNIDSAKPQECLTNDNDIKKKSLSNRVHSEDAVQEKSIMKMNGNVHEIPEIEEELLGETTDEEIISSKDDLTDDISQNGEVLESEKESSHNDVSIDDSNIETSETIEDSNVENSDANASNKEQVHDIEEVERDKTVISHQDDEILNGVLKTDDDVSKCEEDNIIDSILSDQDEKNSHSEER